MSTHHDDELPSLDLADLEHVTGGAGMNMSTMMMMMMMMRGRQAAAAPVAAAPQQPTQPTIMVDGVAQQLMQNADGSWGFTQNS